MQYRESKFKLFNDAFALEHLLEATYEDMINSSEELDLGDAMKELLSATSIRLIESLRSNNPSLDGIVNYLATVDGAQIKKITELVLKITNFTYNNYGVDYIDDALYDELSYLYREKEHSHIFSAPLMKKSVEVHHSFPELKGTLDKVRYVYKEEAAIAGKPSGDDIESFIKRYESTVFGSANPIIECVVSYKYDGVSAVVKMQRGKIIEVLTRGDNEMGADITRLFANYKFPQCARHLMDNFEINGVKKHIDLSEIEELGIQCEVVFKKDKLEEFNEKFKKKYVNGRSAVVGITSAFDIQKKIDGIDLSEYVTLMPLNLSSKELGNLSKSEMMEIINAQLDARSEWAYLTEYSTYGLLEKFNLYRDYTSVKRNDIDYMIDGIVIEFNRPAVRNELGRHNNINNFAIAYKFPSEIKQTKVTNIFFNIGRTGEVVPIVEYEPVYFNGGEFRKTSLSNVTNMQAMALKVGDIINVQYSNDVLCYVTKDYRLPENLDNPNPVIMPPTVCPYCGKPLTLMSKEGLKLYCMNLECPSRVVEHMTNFFDKLNIKDLGRETIQYLYDENLIRNLQDLLRFDPEVLLGREGFGARKVAIIKEAIDKVFNRTYKDYEVLGALGFRAAATTTFRILCARIEFYPILMKGLPISFEERVAELRGFGAKKAKIIAKEMQVILFDNLALWDIIKSMNIEYTYTPFIDIDNGFKVCFTNIRDEFLEQEIVKHGGVVVNSVTKETNLLITKDASVKSSKVDKARKYNIPIMTYAQFKNEYEAVLSKLAAEFNN